MFRECQLYPNSIVSLDIILFILMSVLKEEGCYFHVSAERTKAQNSEPFLNSRKRVKKSKNIIYVTFPDDKVVT